MKGYALLGLGLCWLPCAAGCSRTEAPPSGSTGSTTMASAFASPPPAAKPLGPFVVEEEHAPMTYRASDDEVLQLLILGTRGALPVSRVPAGYRIDDASQGTVLGLARLAKGDVVRSINGVAVTDPDWLVDAYSKVRVTSTVVVEVERQDASLKHTYRLERSRRATGKSAVPPRLQEDYEKVLAGVKRVGEGRYEVRREAFEVLKEQQQLLMRAARIVPEKDGGKVIGMRVFGVRPGSLLAALGLRNGDRLETINGHDLTSPDRALEAYGKVRETDAITLGIARLGKPEKLTYRIVGD